MRPERLLMGPGPSNSHPRVLQAMSRPLTGHMDPEFLTLLDETTERLRRVFQTTNRMTFAVSGTGSAGMEAALVNILEPGDTAIVCVNGVFGGRMCDVVARAGASAVRVEAPWGRCIRTDDVDAALRANPTARCLCVVHAETSTGVAQPLDEIARLVAEHGALFVVDAVTSLAGMPLDVGKLGIDVCYSGTQKCLSVPPGLAPITFSDTALEAVKARKTPVQSWYLDVGLLGRYWGSDRVYHHTAPISMLNALHEGLGLVLEEGLEERWARHERVAARLHEGLRERGFQYESERPLPMLHCVRVPPRLNEATLRRWLLDTYGIEVGAGLGDFAGTCWRVGLMGHTCQPRSVAALLGALDHGLGAGVAVDPDRAP